MTRTSPRQPWELATIIRKRKEPTSYDIRAGNDTMVRRALHQTRSHLAAYPGNGNIPNPIKTRTTYYQAQPHLVTYPHNTSTTKTSNTRPPACATPTRTPNNVHAPYAHILVPNATAYTSLITPLISPNITHQPTDDHLSDHSLIDPPIHHRQLQTPPLLQLTY